MMKKVAMASPFVPPSASPRFQPKYIPEMTYPTPSPHNMTGPKVRGNALPDSPLGIPLPAVEGIGASGAADASPGLFDSWFANDILKVKGFRPSPRIRGSLIPVSASPSHPQITTRSR